MYLEIIFEIMNSYFREHVFLFQLLLNQYFSFVVARAIQNLPSIQLRIDLCNTIVVLLFIVITRLTAFFVWRYFTYKIQTSFVVIKVSTDFLTKPLFQSFVKIHNKLFRNLFNQISRYRFQQIIIAMKYEFFQ